MRKWIIVIGLLFFGSTGLALSGQTTPDYLSPVGFWKTIDDVTGKAKAILKIYKVDQDQLAGKIVQTFPDKTKPSYNFCTACQGEKYNQPIIGLVILEGLKARPGHPLDWTEGKILDPKSGKTYHCQIKVVEEGKKLTVRGYIGLPLFGRTQTWIRTSSAS